MPVDKFVPLCFFVDPFPGLDDKTVQAHVFLPFEKRVKTGLLIFLLTNNFVNGLIEDLNMKYQN